MDWADERYVRVYTRDTAEWLALSWQARGLLALILRTCDRAGIVDLGRVGLKGLSALVHGPWKEIEGPLSELFADGCVESHEHDGITVLVMPNFVEAQEATSSGAQRSRESRARRKDIARATKLGCNDSCRDSATERVAADTNHVANDTLRHAQTHADTARHSFRTVPSVPDHMSESDKPTSNGAVKLTAQVDEVWTHWLSWWQRVRGNGAPPVLDDKRRAHIKARLVQGFTVERLKRAADGCWTRDHNVAGGYTKPEVVYRNAGQVEMYEGFAAQTCQAEGPDEQDFDAEAWEAQGYTDTMDMTPTIR